MSDIHDCCECKEKVYMDNAEYCIVCGNWFCRACEYENGVNLWSHNNDNNYYVCKHCLKQGLEYINNDNEDDAIFTQEEYEKAVKELSNRKSLETKKEILTKNKCIKLSELITYLENIYSENGELDLYSWNGQVTDLKTFIEIDDDIILIDQQGIDTED